MKSDIDVVFVDNGSDALGDVGPDFGLKSALFLGLIR